MTEPDTDPDVVTDPTVDSAAGRPLDGATDVHVHLMPDRLLDAIRGALHEAAGWEFPHPTDRDAIEAELRAHGVDRYCALPYAHKPEIAAELNDWVLERAAESELCVPFATVHGQDDVRAVVREAFEGGARGLKLQCPVQGVAPDDPRLDPAFELAAEYDRPILFHAGTAPMFRDSPHVGVDAFRSFLESYPEVRGCAAHMGAFETEAFVATVREHDNAFLDTCFAMSTAVGDYMSFDPDSVDDAVFEDLAGRVMYGSDYPNIPHPYRAEYEGLLARDLSSSARAALFGGAAERFLGERG